MGYEICLPRLTLTWERIGTQEVGNMVNGATLIGIIWEEPYSRIIEMRNRNALPILLPTAGVWFDNKNNTEIYVHAFEIDRYT